MEAIKSGDDTASRHVKVMPLRIDTRYGSPFAFLLTPASSWELAPCLLEILLETGSKSTCYPKASGFLTGASCETEAKVTF